MNGTSGGVHRALARDQPLGEPLEHAHEQVLDRAEVVVDEAVVDARLLGQPPRRDPGVADLDEQPLGRVEERLLGGRAGSVFARSRTDPSSSPRSRAHRAQRRRRPCAREASTLAIGRPKRPRCLAADRPRHATTILAPWCARITGRSPSCSRRPGGAPRARAGPAGPIVRSTKKSGSISIPPSGLQSTAGATSGARVELVVPGRVERVGDVEPPAVERELEHLRPAVQLATRVVRLAEHAAEPELPGQLGVGRVGDVVLAQVAVQPVREVEEAVVHRDDQVGDQAGDRERPALELDALDGDHLVGRPRAVRR